MGDILETYKMEITVAIFERMEDEKKTTKELHLAHFPFLEIDKDKLSV